MPRGRQQQSSGASILPNLSDVREILSTAIDASVALDKLDISYVKLTDKGPVLFLFEGPRHADQMSYVSAQRLTPEKGHRVAANLNSDAFYAPTLGMLLQIFPQDRRLPSLPTLADGQRVTAVLNSVLAAHVDGAKLRHVDVRPMRYKPQRKCVFRYGLTWDVAGMRTATAPGVIYGKVARQQDFDRTRVILEQILSAAQARGVECNINFPAPLGVVPELCLELFSEVPGTPLTDLCVTESFAAHCADTARKLSQFHTLPVHLSLRWDRAEKIDRVATDAAGLAVLFPEETGHIRILERELCARLHALAAAPLSLIHRDFHGMNVLIAGDCVGFIDLEDCALGDPAEDIGSMYAYLSRLSVERPAQAVLIKRGRAAFLSGYPVPLAEESVAVHAALYCFFQALQQLRHPHVASRYRHAEALLRECEMTLRNGPV